MSAAVFGLGVHFVPMDLLYLWGRTVNKLKLSGMVAMASLLQGCAVTNTITDVGTAVFCGKSSMYCEMISQQTSEDVASGTAYDSAYTIQKAVTGKYVLRSKALKEPIVLARPLSLQKLQSFRTQQATFDIYAAPSEERQDRVQHAHTHAISVSVRSQVQSLISHATAGQHLGDRLYWN